MSGFETISIPAIITLDSGHSLYEVKLTCRRENGQIMEETRPIEEWTDKHRFSLGVESPKHKSTRRDGTYLDVRSWGEDIELLGYTLTTMEAGHEYTEEWRLNPVLRIPKGHLLVLRENEKRIVRTAWLKEKFS